MTKPITEKTNRDALLRHIDLEHALDMIVREYQDLGFAVINQTLIATAYRVGAVICLPVDYVPPAKEASDDQ